MELAINKYTILGNDKYESRETDKVKDSHVKLLKNFLKENKAITCTQAGERLFRETGLELSRSKIDYYLAKIKKEMFSESPNTNSSSSLFEKRRKNEKYTKVKSYHIYLLKKYLKSDKYITPIKARYQLQKETGLEVSVKCIKGYISALRDEIDRECGEAYHSNSESPVRNGYCERNKLKSYHIEVLKNYLKEDNFISSTEARDRIHKETGIKLSVGYTRNILSVLRKIIDSECTNLAASCNESSTMMYCRFNTKLKSYHIDILKRYLKENISITGEQVWNQLRQDTGLEIGLSNVEMHLAVLRREMFGKHIRYDPSFKKGKSSNDFQNRADIRSTNSALSSEDINHSNNLDHFPIANSNNEKTGSVGRVRADQTTSKTSMEKNNLDYFESELICT